jgi:hypothetical protein
VLGETGAQICPERLLGISSQVQPWVYPGGGQTQAVVKCLDEGVFVLS